MTPSELRALRSRLGMTQKELAEAVGVCSDTVARWERGRHKIPGAVERLVKVLADRAPEQNTPA